MKLGENFKTDNTKKLAKLEHDKTMLKRHLKLVRHNNEVFKNMYDELKTKNEDTESHLQDEEWKVEQLEKKVEELETNKLILEANLESTDAALLISQQKTKACNKDLVAAKKTILRFQLTKNRTQLESDIENTDADMVILQQELNECYADFEVEKTCEQSLKKEVRTSRYLQAQKSKLMISLVKSRSSSSANQKLTHKCKNELESEVKEKDNLQEKYESVCQNHTSWSTWSECSETMCGTKTRIDRCSNIDDQIKPCNLDISCPKSGKYKQNQVNLKC